MAKIHCKGCKGLILEKTAQKYHGFSRQCLAKAQKEVKIVKIQKKKSIVELEIEQEQILYQLEKTDKEKEILEELFVIKEDNRKNVLSVLEQICLGMTGQSLAEVLA